MNLKKRGAGCLVLIAVLTAALLSAGCLYQPFPGIGGGETVDRGQYFG